MVHICSLEKHGAQNSSEGNVLQKWNVPAEWHRAQAPNTDVAQKLCCEDAEYMALTLAINLWMFFSENFIAIVCSEDGSSQWLKMSHRDTALHTELETADC
jgi:hypothetical protein